MNTTRKISNLTAAVATSLIVAGCKPEPEDYPLDKFITEFKGQAGEIVNWESKDRKSKASITALYDIGKYNDVWPKEQDAFDLCAYVIVKTENFGSAAEEKDTPNVTRYALNEERVLVCHSKKNWQQVPSKPFEAIPVLPGPRPRPSGGGFGWM